jgi:hypothetical protein
VGDIIGSRYENGRYFCDNECVNLYNPLSLAFARLAILGHSELQAILEKQRKEEELEEGFVQSLQLGPNSLIVTELIA